MAVVVYTDAEGGIESFGDIGGQSYRYSIGPGGLLIVMESSEDNLPSLENAEVHRVFSPTGWRSVEGLEFGDSVRPQLPEGAGEVWTG